MFKKCSKCEIEKPKSEFPKANDRKSGVRSRCKKCTSARKKEKHAENPERQRKYVRDWKKRHPEQKRQIEKNCRLKRLNHYRAKKCAQRKKRKYGLTEAQYWDLRRFQDDKCAICADYLERPCIDHCHTTGIVRGILCIRCNTAIGSLKDSPDICRKAAAYLENFPKQNAED